MLKNFGITIVEIIISISILSIVALSLGPFVAGNFEGIDLSSEIGNFIGILRHAQRLSFSGRGEQSHGIEIEANRYVLFRGDSFASRAADFDQFYERSESVALSGPNEVVFAAGSGAPFSTGTWIFSFKNSSSSVFINEHGTIFW